MADLLLALDVQGREKAIAIAEACAGEIDAIKIGYPLVLSTGLGIVKDLAKFGTPILADFKIADIPNTNSLICDEAFSAGVSGIITHAFCGEDSLAAVVDKAHSYGGEAFVVTEMSHPGALRFLSGENAEIMAKMARNAGADGIIAPATRPERTARLRIAIGTEMKIYTPGVGAQGAQPEDVKRFVDGIIIGRGIYEAADPKKAAHDYKLRCIGNSERPPIHEEEIIVGSWVSDLAGGRKEADETVTITVNADGTMVISRVVKNVSELINATWKKISENRYLLHASAAIWDTECAVMAKYNKEDDTINTILKTDSGAVNPTWRRLN